jgi:hypothetical protein
MMNDVADHKCKADFDSRCPSSVTLLAELALEFGILPFRPFSSKRGCGRCAVNYPFWARWNDCLGDFLAIVCDGDLAIGKADKSSWAYLYPATVMPPLRIADP